MKPLSDLEIALLKTILKDARKSIKEEKDYFLCAALEALEDKHGHKATKYLRRWVTQMLNGHGTLEGWLIYQRQEDFLHADVTKYRIQWINWMIRTLDAERVGRQGFSAGSISFIC